METTTPKSPSRLARAALTGLHIGIECLFILIGLVLVFGAPDYSTPLAIAALVYFLAADMVGVKFGGGRGALLNLALVFGPILAIEAWDVSGVVTGSVWVGLGLEIVAWSVAILGSRASGALRKSVRPRR